MRTVCRLLVAEVRCRPAMFVLSVLAVMVAASLLVAGPALLVAFERHSDQQLSQLRQEADRLRAEADRMQQETDRLLAELDAQTRRIMRDLGVNLQIVHRDTNLGDLYTNFVAVDFPEEYVHRLANAEHIETVVHVVATLQEKIKWRGRTVLLVGTLPVMTVSQKNEEKPHMVKNIDPGTVLVGHELAQGLHEGDSIEILGQSFRIAKIMPEYGTIQDVQLVMHLRDAQQLLGKEGRINQILALNCKCKGDRISAVRRDVESVLPDTKVTEHRTNAEAREKQRDLVEQKRREQLAVVQKAIQDIEATRQQQQAALARQQRLIARLVVVATPLAVFGAAAFVGLMTWMNVRHRRQEIGLLRALGKSAAFVASLLLGKAVLIGLAGGALGIALGYLLALWATGAMEISRELVAIDPRLIAVTLVGAPAVSALASYIPTLAAVTQDPAVVLMDA